MYTPISFSVCRICRKTIEEISEQYKQRGCYKTDYFLLHLKNEHKMNKEQYFGEGPECPCKKCKKKLKIIKDGSLFRWSKLACGRNPGVIEWSEKAKTTRQGKANPMFGAKPWNIGLNKKNSEYGKLMSKKQTGRIVKKETKIKQSISAKKRNIHGHTGHKHSEYSKELMRQATLKRIKNGEFPQTDTLPAKKFAEILKQNNIQYEKEYIIGSWAFDFYLPSYNVLIEIDGDYFHSNPKIYPDGPKTNTQKINRYRDVKKNQFCQEHGHKLIRFWENEVLGEKQCVMQKLQELAKLELNQQKTLK